jgi:hypothetical protein
MRDPTQSCRGSIPHQLALAASRETFDPPHTGFEAHWVIWVGCVVSTKTAPRHLQREFEPLRAEPQPHAPDRAGLGEMYKDLADGSADGFIRMKTNLAVLLAPDKADGQAAPEFAARRLVANPPLRRARNMCNSASLIVPFNPSKSLSLNTAG